MPATDDDQRLFLLRTASVLLMLYFIVFFAIYNETDNFQNWSGTIRLSLLLILLFVICQSYMPFAIQRDDARELWWLLWIQAVLIVGLHASMNEMGMVLNFVGFWVARTPNVYELRTCTYLTAGAIVLFLLTYVVRGMGDFTEILLYAVLAPTVFFFILTISYTSISLQRQRQKATELNRELQAAQLQLAQTSRAGERLRIARDIHDLLGHQMTALILNLEVASHKASGEALTHIERAQALARMLLGDLRNAVSDIRDDPALDFESDLAELLANVPELKVTLEREASLVIDDPHVAEVLLRCIQEALTNTLRHAHATRCHIRLYTQEGQLVLDVSNDGTTSARVTPGNGLKGMQERLAALAGSLHWQHDKGSFHLRARLPFAGAQP